MATSSVALWSRELAGSRTTTHHHPTRPITTHHHPISATDHCWLTTSQPLTNHRHTPSIPPPAVTPPPPSLPTSLPRYARPFYKIKYEVS